MSTIVASESAALLVRYSVSREEMIRERLVELHTGLVRGLARRFAHRGEPLEDLEQVGFLGLILAIERFDPARGTEFTSFAVPTIVGEIRRHFRGIAWSVRVPRLLQETYLRVRRSEDELSQELGRTPSVAEIALHLGLDPDRVLAALEVAPARRAVSLDTPAGVTDRERGMALRERLGEPDSELARLEARLLVEQAMANLTPRERRVMTLRFVSQLSQREVAERLGVSPVEVVQLQGAALERARRDLGGAAPEGDGEAIRSLTETIREDGVDPLRRAEALQDLRTRLGRATWEEVGRVVGLTRRHIHHLLNVTHLPEEMREELRTGRLSEKHARALLLVRDSRPCQATLWQRIRTQVVSGTAALRMAQQMRAEGSS
ncbi:MAG TPA: SigB/SigF/SigG family RNA polymerase sigma factor [Candidatus Dormibacteraeota bacterium]|nr:SigB/SigF/SigG family RNA polymerase sigma factor [Candidatus Dormibacteraeota bacterium]